MDPETEKKAFLNTLSEDNNIDGFRKLNPVTFQTYFTNNIFSMPHARNMMTDFITLLRNEGINNTDGKKKKYNSLATKINADCKKIFLRQSWEIEFVFVVVRRLQLPTASRPTLHATT